MKIESTHLVTLSQFVTNIKEESSSLSSRDAQEIVLYNDFLKQPLTIEMFDIGEERLFKDFEISATEAHWIVSKRSTTFFLVFNRETGRHIDNKDFNYLAEITKSNPLRFKKQPYFDNEEIH